METQIVPDKIKNKYKNVVLPDFMHGTKQLHYHFFDICAGAKFDFSAHWHPEYEITVAIDGHVDFIVEGKLCRLNPGEALFLHSDAVHGHADFYADYGRYICFSFGEEFLFPDNRSFIYNHFFKPIQSGEYSFTTHIKNEMPHEKQLSKIFQDLAHLSQNIPENALSIQIALLNIFNIMIKARAFPKNTDPLVKNDIIKSALRYIKSNLFNQISVGDIALALNISTDHFTRLFKASVGATPKDYILDMRIQNSISEINSNPGCKLAEVAHSSGFSDPNYFSRAFKSKIGISPSEYIQLILK